MDYYNDHRFDLTDGSPTLFVRIRICNRNRKRIVEHELGSLETKSVTALIRAVLRLIPEPAHSFPTRMSTIELFELVSRTGKTGQTDAIDQIKGTGCPFVVLVLLVGTEDELRDREHVRVTISSNVS